jgi:hypothetical protein
LAERARLTGRPIDVKGTPVKGSLAYQEKPCEYHFKLVSGAVELPVRYPVCVVPDTFRRYARARRPGYRLGQAPDRRRLRGVERAGQVPLERRVPAPGRPDAEVQKSAARATFVVA